jgi:hypothetical protein
MTTTLQQLAARGVSNVQMGDAVTSALLLP